MEWIRRRSFVSLVALVLVTTALAASASTVSAASTRRVTSVVFTGTSAAPTITVNGFGFGATAPASISASVTSCGTYSDNGSWFGNNGLWFGDNTNDWQAGKGTAPGHGNCIGIKLVSWTGKKVVFGFGNAYGSFDHWTVDQSDNYVIALKNYYWGGVVSYS